MRTCVNAKLKTVPLTSRPPVMAQPRPPIGQYQAGTQSGRVLRSNRHVSVDRSPGEEESEDELDVDLDEYPAPACSELRQRLATLQEDESLNPNPAHGPNTHPTAPKLACSTQKLVLIGVLVLAAIGVFYVYGLSSDSNKHSLDKRQWLRENWSSNIQFIRDKFPSQKKNIWSDFYSGIQKVLLEEPTEPSIFLLVHRGTDATSSCLAWKVGEVAHNYLNASRPHPLLLDGRVLGSNAAMMEDYGLLTETYRPLVEEHRIMILNNLEQVPATIARGLHTFCDTVTPLVQKAVYIFTLNVDSRGSMEGNPTKIAETELNSAWKQLDQNIRSALVARITSGSVFRIEPEEGMRNVC